MKRIALFLATNVAILLVLSVSMRLLGVEAFFMNQGVNLNVEGLLIFAALLGFGGSFLSLALSKWSAKRIPGLRIIESPANATEKWLLETVERQAREAGIGMPEVAIVDSPAVNAFATGASRDNALVAVYDGLLQSMRREEAEAVMAHEISHVANGDMVTLTLIQGVVNTFVIFLSRVIGHTVDRVILKNERGHGIGFWVTTIIAELILGVLASIIVMWFSRYREFRADAGGAALSGRQNMINALRRLQMQSGSTPLPDKMAAFGISGKRDGVLARLFMTHPPLEERIEALERGA